MLKPVKTDKTPLIVLGAGDYNAVVIDTFARYAEHFPWRLAGLAQNVDPSKRGATVEGYPVYTMEELPGFSRTHRAHCLLGDCDAKRRFVEEVEALGFRFATLEHPGCRFLGDLAIGEGCYLGFDTIYFRGAELGRHCTVLTQRVIGEGAQIGDYGFMAPGVKVSGNVTVGEGTFIGVGSIITERLAIGRGAIIGAGSVVVRDVPDGAVVVGNPAREIPRKGGPLKTRIQPARELKP